MLDPTPYNFRPHFCLGTLDLGFVFSVPGAHERNLGRPVAGETGRNLSMAITQLNRYCPNIFLSTNIYDYRITNAFDQPIARKLGHKFSEASRDQVLAERNVERVCSELEGCSTVILCGERAKLLADAIENLPASVISVIHISNTALNKTFPSLFLSRFSNAEARRFERVRLWAYDVASKLSNNTV